MRSPSRRSPAGPIPPRGSIQGRHHGRHGTAGSVHDSLDWRIHEPGTVNKAQAFRDNLQLPSSGVRASELNAKQRALLTDLIAEYVGNMDDGHAKIRMEEVRAHLDETYFAWIGEYGPDSVFYYRVQSPVILIEFDHQTPVALPGPKAPNRQHIHSVVRTPNGNDYGKDLLRQHYEQHKHDPWHGHAARWQPARQCIPPPPVGLRQRSSGGGAIAHTEATASGTRRGNSPAAGLAHAVLYCRAALVEVGSRPMTTSCFASSNVIRCPV